ncbi:MAG: lipopolysaccharide transport system ATP-binding protein, partial [Pyrinomonadaceae bacterium]|nr:lipopolysaccharide transport system ATP-binding protein [Pyrinomonadaceae bacterium]
MNDIAINVVGLGKRYRLGRLQQRHDTLRDRIASARLFHPFNSRNGGPQNAIGPAVSADSTLWALKNVSFAVKR